jgi:tetratricopeptide (TPR) repeat protein
MNLKPVFFCLFLAFLSLGVYYPTLFAPYNSLDDKLLVQQLLNQTHFSFTSLFSPGGTYDYYRPLLTLTFEIDKYFGGLQEIFSHFVNILLHTLNVLLIFQLSRSFAEFVRREGDFLPFLSAAIFCIHPINTEAVNWVTARSDLLAGTFVFSSLFFVLKALDRRSLLLGGAAAVALFGGALCKETALFLFPCIFLLLVWRPRAVRVAWAGRWTILFLCLCAVMGYFSLRWGAYSTDRGLDHTAKFIEQVSSVAPLDNAISPVSKSISIMNIVRVALKASGYYATKLFQPLPLNFAINRVNGLYIVPGLILAFVLPYLMFRRRPVGVLFVLSAILGSSALLVLFTGLAWTPVAERYMYIPSGIFSIAVVYGSADLVESFKWQKVCLVVAPALFGICVWATINRNFVWQDNLTLYQDTVRKSPDFGPARNELALALFAHNFTVEASKLIESVHIPDGQESSLNKAAVLAAQGHYLEARTFLLHRLEHPGSNDINILNMLVKVTSKMAEKSTDQTERRLLYQEKIRWLERLEYLTHNPFHWYQMGRVYLILKNRQEAQRCFSVAAKRLPTDSIYREPAVKLAKSLAF